jgi:hypothetical protein
MNTTKPQIPINKSIVNIYIIVSKIFNTLLGKQTFLTSEILEFFDVELKYSNTKIVNTLDYKFIDISDSIEKTLNKK